MGFFASQKPTRKAFFLLSFNILILYRAYLAFSLYCSIIKEQNQKDLNKKAESYSGAQTTLLIILSKSISLIL